MMSSGFEFDVIEMMGAVGGAGRACERDAEKQESGDDDALIGSN